MTSVRRRLVVSAVALTLAIAGHTGTNAASARTLNSATRSADGADGARDDAAIYAKAFSLPVDEAYARLAAQDAVGQTVSMVAPELRWKVDHNDQRGLLIELWRAPGEDVVMVKASWWLGV